MKLGIEELSLSSRLFNIIMDHHLLEFSFAMFDQQ
jgi:hypothetical protein